MQKDGKQLKIFILEFTTESEGKHPGNKKDGIRGGEDRSRRCQIG